MIRRRFPIDRTVRILTWAGVVTAWVTVLVSRTVGAPATEPVAVLESVPLDPTTTAPAVGTTDAGVPDMPEDGLVIIRATPTIPPEPVIVRQVAPAPAAQPAPVATSSGS